MLAAIIGLLAFAAASPGQNEHECISQVTKALEVSGDDPRNIATATIQACTPTDALRMGASSPGSLWSTMSSEERAKVLELKTRLTTDSIILMVERIRACRKTPGCKTEVISFTTY